MRLPSEGAAVSCAYCEGHFREDLPCPQCDAEVLRLRAQVEVAQNVAEVCSVARAAWEEAAKSSSKAFRVEKERAEAAEARAKHAEFQAELDSEHARLAEARAAKSDRDVHEMHLIVNRCGKERCEERVETARLRAEYEARAADATELLASATRFEFYVPGQQHWWAIILDPYALSPTWVVAPNDDGFNCSKPMSRDEAIAEARRLSRGE
jgi:hypothetical protein